MTDDKKVVDLHGKAVTPKSETSPGVINILEDMLATARAGTYKAVAVVLTDDHHLAVTARHFDEGYDCTTGLSYIQYRINKSRDIEDERPNGNK